MTSTVTDAASFRADWLDGFVQAYRRYVEPVPGASGVVRAGGPRQGKVSVIIGGGCGHYPAFGGLVGAGLADAAVVGDVFTSPSAEQAYRVARAVDGGAGVLFSFGNYAGDVLNFGVAEERLRRAGIDCRTVLVTDDVASAPARDVALRRGIGGGLVVFKAAGAAAAEGAPLDEVERAARVANEHTRTVGAAFSACHLPGQRDPLFTVKPGTFEIGLGIHGEPGIRTVDEAGPAELARMLVQPLLDEAPAAGAGRAIAVLNGLGATKYEELFVLWSHMAGLLGQAGVELLQPEVGEFVTSLDMSGCSLTLCWADDELARWWKAPAATPGFRRGEVSQLPEFPALGVAHGPDQEDQAVASDASPASRQTAGLVRAALAAMTEAVEEAQDELGRLDAVAGDGDHGTGMTRGLRAARETATAAEGGAGSVLTAAGRAFADRAGGTSGILWGLLLEVAGHEIGDTDTPDAAAVARAVCAAATAVQRIGKASRGDKTLIDALLPFADALQEGVRKGQPLAAAWAQAADVARDAAASTAGLRPRLGRARPLADRSVGSPDPGAVSMALCLAAAGSVLGAAQPSRRQGEKP